MMRCNQPIPCSAFNNDGSIFAYAVCSLAVISEEFHYFVIHILGMIETEHLIQKNLCYLFATKLWLYELSVFGCLKYDITSSSLILAIHSISRYSDFPLCMLTKYNKKRKLETLNGLNFFYSP